MKKTNVNLISGKIYLYYNNCWKVQGETQHTNINIDQVGERSKSRVLPSVVKLLLGHEKNKERFAIIINTSQMM